jgi:hypothetical protein
MIGMIVPFTPVVSRVSRGLILVQIISDMVWVPPQRTNCWQRDEQYNYTIPEHHYSEPYRVNRERNKEI